MSEKFHGVTSFFGSPFASETYVPSVEPPIVPSHMPEELPLKSELPARRAYNLPMSEEGAGGTVNLQCNAAWLIWV